MGTLYQRSIDTGGQGWDLGRDVFLSDVAAELERTGGVDFVRELTLLLGGVPQGEAVAVGEEQIVAAGAPIVPIVAEPLTVVCDTNRHLARPGRLRMRVLEPVPTEGLDSKDLPSLVFAVRSSMQARR